jgi:hypothetical protein
MVSIWHFYLPPLSISVWLLILAGALFNYLILAASQSHYYFYDNQIVQVFALRLFYRRGKVLGYENIKIIYIHTVGMGGEPQFVIFRRQYKKFYIGNLLNTFYFNTPSKRVQIVNFLLSKNVHLEVRSDFEKKDKEIIDLVKKKYPNNIR